MNEADIRFGHPYFNTATMAGIYRMVLKWVAEEYGVELPIKEQNLFWDNLLIFVEQTDKMYMYKIFVYDYFIFLLQ